MAAGPNVVLTSFSRVTEISKKIPLTFKGTDREIGEWRFED